MERELSRLVDALPGLMWTATPDGAAEIVGHRWLEYTGLSANAAAGSGWLQALHDDDRPRLLIEWSAILESAEAGELVARLRRRDGVYRRFLFRASPLVDEEGRIERWYGINIDIEDRLSAEEALRERQRSFQDIVEGLPAYVALFASDGSMTYANQWALDYHGLTIGQLTQASGGVHPDDLGEATDRWRASLASGQPYECEARLLRRDGDFRWNWVRGHPLRAADGTIDFWYGVCVDIDETKRAQAQLAAEKRLLEKVAEDAPLLEVTEAICREVEALSPGRLCGILLTSDDNQRVIVGGGGGLPAAYNIAIDGLVVDPSYGPCLLAMATKAPVTVDDIANDPRWRASPWPSLAHDHGLASCWSSPILSGKGDVLGSFAIYRRAPAPRTLAEQELVDRFTRMARIAIERTQIDAALDRARSELAHVSRVMTLSTLTASIAHEINQPLAGIITNASTCLRMLAAEPPNLEGARATAQRTIRDGNRASEVVQRLRVLFAKGTPARGPVDLNDAAREVVALSTSELVRGRVTLRLELDEALTSVTGDRVQLQQVILNLLLNAAEAMSAVEDRPRELVVATDQDSGGLVRLSVRDTGIGLSRSAEKLFDAFHTTKPGGMGIGLSVSRSIVESHGGRLWGEPNQGPGATFVFSIPTTSERPDASFGTRQNS